MVNKKREFYRFPAANTRELPLHKTTSQDAVKATVVTYEQGRKGAMSQHTLMSQGIMKLELSRGEMSDENQTKIL